MRQGKDAAGMQLYNVYSVIVLCLWLRGLVDRPTYVTLV